MALGFHFPKVGAGMRRATPHSSGHNPHDLNSKQQVWLLSTGEGGGLPGCRPGQGFLGPVAGAPHEWVAEGRALRGPAGKEYNNN